MILVTGANGFVGSHIINQLIAKNLLVVGLIRNLNSINNHPILTPQALHEVQWKIGDIVNPYDLQMAMQGITHVYHTAAIVSFDKKDKPLLYSVNVEGTRNVVNACLAAQVEKLMHISSVAALGRTSGKACVDELSAWDNGGKPSYYGLTKHLAELEIWRAAEEGLKVNMVRPSIILGVGNWDSSSLKIVKQVAKGLPLLSPGSSGFVDVHDVANAAIAIMESDLERKAFVLNGSNTSFSTIVTLLGKHLNVPTPTKTAPYWLAKTAAYFLSFVAWFSNKPQLITPETVHHAYSHFCYNNQAIINAIAFEFTPLEKTIARIALAYKK